MASGIGNPDSEQRLPVETVIAGKSSALEFHKWSGRKGQPLRRRFHDERIIFPGLMGFGHSIREAVAHRNDPGFIGGERNPFIERHAFQ